jgi:hypothetical protein
LAEERNLDDPSVKARRAAARLWLHIEVLCDQRFHGLNLKVPNLPVRRIYRSYTAPNFSSSSFSSNFAFELRTADKGIKNKAPAIEENASDQPIAKMRIAR